VTAVGDDPLGRDALDLYRREGIDVSHARVVPGVASGVALIFVGEAGENMIGVAPGANAHLSPEDIDRLPDSVFDGGGVLLASLEVPLEAVLRGLRRAKAAGMTTVLNPAPADPDVVESGLLRSVDVLTPNATEARLLAGHPPQDGWEAAWRTLGDLHHRGLSRAVVTLGAQGCLIVDPRTDSPLLVKAFDVRAVDTVGAGDAFNGALAAAVARGRSLVEAARWANAAAALAVTRPGAQGGLPYRDEIDRLAASHREPPKPDEGVEPRDD
jgi:ribokinase